MKQTARWSRTPLSHGLRVHFSVPSPQYEPLVLIVEQLERVVAELLGRVLFLHLVARTLQDNRQDKVEQHRLREHHHGREERQAARLKWLRSSNTGTP